MFVPFDRLSDMKRHLSGLIIYILTMSLGLCLGWFFAGAQPVESEAVIAIEKTPTTQVPAPVAKRTPFNAEFQGLARDDEIVYPQLDNDLIDVYNTEGIYRESEVVAKSGEKWLTLFETNGRYSMKWATAKVKKTTSISYPGDEFDVHLKFDKPGSPVFSVRNLTNVKPGPITSLYLRPTEEEIDKRNLPIDSMETGFKRGFYLNEKQYTLRVSTGETRTGEPVGVLVLEHDGVEQIIDRNYFDPDHGTIIGDLLWAGDLDNDGKLDLYFDSFNEKGAFWVGLYLSSHAEDGDLVKLVADFGTAGC